MLRQCAGTRTVNDQWMGSPWPARSGEPLETAKHRRGKTCGQKLENNDTNLLRADATAIGYRRSDEEEVSGLRLPGTSAKGRQVHGRDLQDSAEKVSLGVGVQVRRFSWQT